MISSVGSNNALGSYYGATSALTLGAAKNCSMAASDTVEISESGRLLSRLPKLKLPNWQSVREFKSEFSAKFREALDKAGISSDPPFSITQNVNTGAFTVTGDNPRAADAQDLLNGSDELRMLHHNMQAIASHIPAMEEGLKFQQEYRAANGFAEIQAVVAKYSSLFSGTPSYHSFATTYGDEGAALFMDGKVVA